MNLKNWITAFRLRTLTLSLSCVMMAYTAARIFEVEVNYLILTFTVLTTVFLQILSNVANDYGDAVSGADDENRVGPERMTASGKISKNQMKNAVIVFSILSLMSGILLLYFSREFISLQAIGILFLIGIGAIAAAIKYTVGKSPYGYSGFGDIFVFIFFGLVAVIGSFYLFTGTFELQILFPAITMGFLSMGVLNLNNMRDHVSDKLNNKNTLVVKIGIQKAFIYHVFIILSALMSIIIFVGMHYNTYIDWIFLLSTPLFFLALKSIASKLQNPVSLDPELKKLAISTLILNILLLLGFML